MRTKIESFEESMVNFFKLVWQLFPILAFSVPCLFQQNTKLLRTRNRRQRSENLAKFAKLEISIRRINDGIHWFQVISRRDCLVQQ